MDKKLSASQTWDKSDMESSRKSGYSNSIYPDTVIWGMEFNGWCNPTVLTVLNEIVKAVNTDTPSEEAIKDVDEYRVMANSMQQQAARIAELEAALKAFVFAHDREDEDLQAWAIKSARALIGGSS